MTESAQGPYKVEAAGLLLQQLRELTRKASQRGFREAFLSAIREIARRLATDPEAWGDQLHTYRTIGIVEYHRIQEMLLVRYGVDSAHKVVYWKECIPVLNHPLAKP